MNIIRDGIVLAVYLFIICSLYIFTSQPFHEITSTLSGLSVSADKETQDTITMADTVYAIIFVLLGGIPLLWFIMRVFQRDPTWGYFR